MHYTHFVLNGLLFYVHFQMHVMSKRRPRTFLIFVYEMLVFGLHMVRIWWERFEGDRRCDHVYIIV